MNSKLIKGSLAGVAALALAAGGSTFAAWSDSDSIGGNVTTAGHLQIDLDSSGTINNVATAIAPGEYRTQDVMIASADLNGVPEAALSFKLLHLVDLENGCGGTNSEAATEDCTVEPGEFSRQAFMKITYTDPAAAGDVNFTGTECTAPSGYNNSYGFSPATSSNRPDFPRVRDVRNAGSIPLGDLADGEAVCVRVAIGLEDTATDRVQTDSSEFDLEFRLDQII